MQIFLSKKIILLFHFILILLQENVDIYSTNEPQGAFHQRVSFCLDLYNQSVRVCKISYGYHKCDFQNKDIIFHSVVGKRIVTYT